MLDTTAAPAEAAPEPARRRSRLVTGFLGLVTVGLAGFAVCRLAGIDATTPFAQLISFTPYAAGAGLVTILLATMLGRWRISILATLAAVALTVVVMPRAIGGQAPPAADSVRLRVMTVNLWQGNAVDELMAILRREKPDLLSIQEITPEAAERLEAAGLRKLLPYDASRPAPGVAGTALYGRAEFTGLRTLDAGSRFDMARAWHVHQGVRLDVVAAHPTPPVPGGDDAVGDWRRELDRLPRGRIGDGVVTLLAGDFNATLDHSPFRRLLASGYLDAADAVGAGLHPTWQAGWVPPVTLDHVLVEREPGVGVRTVRVHPVAASDHRAVIADLTLPA